MVMSLSRLKHPALFVLLLATLNGRGTELDTIGSTLLHQVAPDLLGNGIPVAQPEGPNGVAGAFEVNPDALGLPVSFFTWISSAGTANTYPNGVGTESGHADVVGDHFYGLTNGVAPQVSPVDNYDADYFFNNLIDVRDFHFRAGGEPKFYFCKSGPESSIDK